ncbi:ubiquinone biosynthesis protein COQ9 [Limimonas halophila]|uniref:Ubiquinone biosynthesis protein COQ9 n=1 Tax=Limimonas halophila TaxID=1082479 RepID=A0A1G7LQR3_9PROT|nr:COQ9 family protein [Limimonas halophila]SDF51736.1 ubiquinone biosynthesis protein COQ9 [Limimonas halophila]
MTAPDSPSEIRRTIREAMLGHVPFDGWSWDAFKLAVEDTGVDPVLARDAFPNGPADVLAATAAEADAAMLSAMERHGGDGDPAERLAEAIRIRLEYNAGHEDAVRRGLAFLAMPGNTRSAWRLLMRTVDAVRTAAGDTATGLRGMARRNALASVYSATLLVWLEDASEGREVTWDFLHRRLRPLTGAGSLADRGLARASELPRRLREAAPAALPLPGGPAPEADADPLDS